MCTLKPIEQILDTPPSSMHQESSSTTYAKHTQTHTHTQTNKQTQTHTQIQT